MKPIHFGLNRPAAHRIFTVAILGSMRPTAPEKQSVLFPGVIQHHRPIVNIIFSPFILYNLISANKSCKKGTLIAEPELGKSDPFAAA
jgi:hypothetical protein